VPSASGPILLINNFYRSDSPSGENQSFLDEKELLERSGETVIEYTLESDEIEGYSPLQKVSLPVRTIWSERSRRDVRRLIQMHAPRLAHCHNTFPLISPSVYYACKEEGVPIVQTIRNFRISCVNAHFFRDGKVCELCLGKPVALHGIRHRCYRDKASASANVAAISGIHRALNTWNRLVDLFIVPSEFARTKAVEMGLDGSKIRVKPDVVQPSSHKAITEPRRDAVLFTGRFTREKGVDVLLAAWGSTNLPGFELILAGDGPLRPEIEEASRDDSTIKVLPPMPPQDIRALMRTVRAVICPSTSYETFGRVIVESCLEATPVIASRSGALPELVEEGQTGFTFPPGDIPGLAAALARTKDSSLRPLDGDTVAKFTLRFSPQRNRELLLGVYDSVVAQPR
jgi:glycosyltransferase involved in cell wall biosynthesis